MASTFSTDLKLELMATGENAGTWGTKTNTNLNLVQQAVAGYESISVQNKMRLTRNCNRSIKRCTSIRLNKRRAKRRSRRKLLA